MQVADVEGEIRRFLVSRFPLAASNGFQDDDALLGSVVDSSGVIELVEFLQDRFAIAIADEDITMENLDSVKHAAAFVNRKTSAQA